METTPSPLSIWLLAIRPKTLFASVSPIIVGSAVARHEGGFHLLSTLVALLVAVLLQIIANLANVKLGGKIGDYKPIHPNDHVNMAQSTNDVVPTAIRVVWAFQNRMSNAGGVRPSR